MACPCSPLHSASKQTSYSETPLNALKTMSEATQTITKLFRNDISAWRNLITKRQPCSRQQQGILSRQNKIMKRIQERKNQVSEKMSENM